MRSRTAVLFVLISLAAILSPVHAQRPAVPATIGNSVVTLNGPWAFHPGDNMAWAQPDYDDSAWATLDLTPPPGSYDPTTGSSGFVPGWTTMGYPKLAGYAWYRLRVNVSETSGSQALPLAIRMPIDIDDAYQVYVNGQFIGEFGHFAPHGVTFINAQPRAFPLPANLRGGTIVIAIRMWMDAATPFVSPDGGGLHGPPLLGQAGTVDTMLEMAWNEVDRGEATAAARIPILGMVALFGLVLFWLDRREKAYLWLALACTAYVLNLSLVLIGYYATWLSMVLETVLTDVILSPLTFGMWTIFWGYWFGLKEMRRIHRATWSLVLLLILGVGMLRAPLYGSVVPVSASSWLTPLTIALRLVFGGIIFWIVYRGIRTRGVEGWLALVPVLLMPLWLYQDELTTLHLYRAYRVLGISFGLNFVAIVLMLTAISLLMLRRFVNGLRQKQQLETEMEQARQVQQVLIPETLPRVPGFEIQSEYRPAQQVGGDFFQIVPLDVPSLYPLAPLRVRLRLRSSSNCVFAWLSRSRRLRSLLRVASRLFLSSCTCCCTLIVIFPASDGSATLVSIASEEFPAASSFLALAIRRGHGLCL